MHSSAAFRRRAVVVLALCAATAGTAQESDRRGSFGPSEPAEVADVRWDIAAFHPDYERRSRSVLKLRVRAPLRFARDASIDDVNAVYLYDWDNRYWTLEVPGDWSVSRQRLSETFIDTSISENSQAITIGPTALVVEFSDGRRVEEPLILTPPGSDHASALFVYEPRYAGDIGAAHVQTLSYAEVHSAELTRRPDGGGILKAAFAVDDSRVFTGRLYVIDSDGDAVTKSEFFRPWGGGPTPPELNRGEELRTDGELNTYTLASLSPTERERAAAVYILLLDGPDTYHYRSFSATVPIDSRETR